jgi:SAM-dependent methyltransferase
VDAWDQKLDSEQSDSPGQASDIHIPWLLLVPQVLERRVLVLGYDSVFGLSGLAERNSVVCICTFSGDEENLFSNSPSLRKFENITITTSDSLSDLPFENDSFDLCIADGRMLDRGDSKLLAEIFRVLSERGTIFLSAKNGLYYRRIRSLGKSPYGLGAYLKLLWHGIRESGCGGYRGILKMNHFQDLHCYSMATEGGSNRIFDFGGPQETRPFFGKNSVGKISLSRTLKRSRVFEKYFGQGYGVRASKIAEANCVLDEIVANVAAKVSPGINRCGPEIFVTQKGSAVFFVEDTDAKERGGYIVKVSLGGVATEQLSGNYGSILAIHDHPEIAEDVKKCVPVPVCKSECCGYSYFVEEKVSGYPAVSLTGSGAAYDQVLDEASSVIQELHSSSSHFLPAHSDRQKELVLEKISQVGRLVPRERQEELNAICSYLIDKLVDEGIPMVFHKGDCSANNILVENGGKLSLFLIDWDQSCPSYFPFVDIINLLESFKRNRDNIAMGDVLINSYFKQEFSGTESAIISRYCDEMGLVGTSVFPLTILYWLDHVCAQNFTIIENNSVWIRNNIFSILTYLKNNLK